MGCEEDVRESPNPVQQNPSQPASQPGNERTVCFTCCSSCLTSELRLNSSLLSWSVRCGAVRCSNNMCNKHTVD